MSIQKHPNWKQRSARGVLSSLHLQGRIRNIVQQVVEGKVNTMDKTAVVIVGLPCTGKSTIARGLQEEIGGQVLDPDTFIWEQTENFQEYMSNNPAAGRQIGATFWRDLKRIVEYENEDTLIIDRCNVNKARRVPLIKYLQRHDFEVYCIALENEPFPDDRKGTPDAVVERLRREYETPTVEEGFEEVEVWNL